MTAQESIILRREYKDKENNELLDKAFINLVFESIFDPGIVQDSLKKALVTQDHNFRSFDALILAMRNFFASNIPRMLSELKFGEMSVEVFQQAKNLAVFEKKYRQDLRRYDPAEKSNPNAIFWPNPTHPVHPGSLFETLPFIDKVNILDKSTPVGSAGSCFASEIALYFQKNHYNYIVEEESHDDGDMPRSSARWGILFNTPSFLQLVEKAFGVRKMPSLVEFNDANGRWQDPFRENVIFPSIEALENDRKKHLEACRRVFERCKVFILTLGLNECWEYIPDGCVASRFPKSRQHAALFRHKTLTVSDNLMYLESFLHILRDQNPGIQLIVSVSPIPCLATGRSKNTHVVTANEHSKATLRIVAEEFTSNNTGVYYFPSYEMVTRCIENPWDKDQRHVTGDAIERVMELFETMFVKGP